MFDDSAAVSMPCVRELVARDQPSLFALFDREPEPVELVELPVEPAVALDELVVDDGQPLLFSERELCPWLDEWQGMPEFICDDLAPRYQLLVSFATAADVADFAALVGQRFAIGDELRQTKSIWFPEQEIGRIANKRYRDQRVAA